MPQGVLATFAVLAYNQESFVREAVDGAFAQTHSPLEIILSDDHSRDSTFAVMRELASGYGGPHRVVLNRNPRNLGIGAHVNVINSIASGRFLVFAGGDDVSLPERTSLTVAPFLALNSADLLSVACEFSAIDSSGRPMDIGFPDWRVSEDHRRLTRTEMLKRFVETLAPYSPGCVHTCRRELLSMPSPLPSGIATEDLALSFRGHLFGHLDVVSRTQVHYRVHSSNISQFGSEPASPREFVDETERRMWQWYRNASVLYEGFQRDLGVCGSVAGVSEQQLQQLLTEIRRRGDLYSVAFRQLGAPWWNRALTPWQIARLGGPSAMVRAALLRILPPGTAAALRRLRVRQGQQWLRQGRRHAIGRTPEERR